MKGFEKRLARLESGNGSIAELHHVFPDIDVAKLESKHHRRLAEIYESGWDGDCINMRLIPKPQLSDLCAIYLICNGQQEAGETIFDGHRKFTSAELLDMASKKSPTLIRRHGVHTNDQT